jgi:hypothetical protein
MTLIPWPLIGLGLLNGTLTIGVRCRHGVMKCLDLGSGNTSTVNSALKIKSKSTGLL